MCLEYREICHIQPQEVTYDNSCCPLWMLLLAFSIEILSSEAAAKPSRNSSFGILCSTSSSHRRATDPSFGHYQSLACLECHLHLKAQRH
jgi:hypothetical protein